MSLGFGVMSPYTAWLAVPRSEFEFYKKMKAEGRVATNVRTARGGDPLVRVYATPDVVRVTAFLPTGEPVPLARHNGVWEGRFDLPAETAEGDYEVLVLIERADGTVKRITLSYRIDRSGPAGRARLEREGGRWKVRVTADTDTRQAYLLLPDGSRLPLTAAGDHGEFEARLENAVPDGAELVLVDGAHNVTRLGLDLRSGGPGEVR
jgi:hypothetical protein